LFRGAPKQFTRKDIDNAATRKSRPQCRTHIATRRPGLRFVILNAGALDDPKAYGPS
jgi:hypothetical protein